MNMCYQLIVGLSMEFLVSSVDEKYACGIKQKEEGIMSICTGRAAPGITRSVTTGIPCDWIGFHHCREFRTCTMIRVKLPPYATMTRNYTRVIIIFCPAE